MPLQHITIAGKTWACDLPSPSPCLGHAVVSGPTRSGKSVFDPRTVSLASAETTPPHTTGPVRAVQP